MLLKDIDYWEFSIPLKFLPKATVSTDFTCLALFLPLWHIYRKMKSSFEIFESLLWFNKHEKHVIYSFIHEMQIEYMILLWIFN